jgi:DNA repair protein RecN (Recombination protein N)
MLIELHIGNFAIIDQVTLSFSSGFSVLSGETGAGKSMIIDALGILRGDRFDASHIRSGTDRSRIEGVFQVKPHPDFIALLDEHGLREEGDDSIIILREVNRESNRTVSRINGRAVTNAVVREVGSWLIDIHGQHDGLTIFNAKTHLDILDRFGALFPARQKVSDLYTQWRSIRTELNELRTAADRRTERIQELRSLQADVSAAKLVQGEEESLVAERTRFQNGARITELTTQIYQSLTGDERRPRGIVDSSVVVAQLCADLQKYDPSFESIVTQATELQYALADLAQAVRSYRDRIEFDPGRIEAIEDRITELRALQRKYRATIPELIERATQAASELDKLEHSDEYVAALEQQELRMRGQLGTAAHVLSQQRATAAIKLASAVEASARDLAMPHVRFAVQQTQTNAFDGVVVSQSDGTTALLACDRSGVDRVEFLIAPNPGEEPKSLAKTASGGEGSRLFLAIKSVLAQVEVVETMVFDEVDTGVGGRAGAVVGEKLWNISRHHQVLCISHLPQVATFADTHYAISKKVSAERTSTHVVALDEHARVDELAAMLNGHPVSAQSRSVAADMLTHARERKAIRQ